MNRMNRHTPNRTTQAHMARVKAQQAMFRQASAVDARRLFAKKDRPSPPQDTEATS